LAQSCLVIEFFHALGEEFYNVFIFEPLDRHEVAVA
jgi:hypothetical protein